MGASKLLAVDSGLAADLVGRSAGRLVKGDPLAGPLLENFALGEIARLLPVATERARLLHFRTKDGVEVDGVVETRDRRIAGVVLHTGRAIRSLGDRLWAIPLDSLWTGPPAPPPP